MTHRIRTKAEAWVDPPADLLRNTPIDQTEHQFEFTRSWFRNRNQTTFSTFLPPKFDGSRPVRLIQIGVFEGADLVWQFQNTLRHPDSFAFAIDPWAATTKLDQQTMDKVAARAASNLRPWKKKLQLHRGFSQDILAAAVKAGRLAGVRSGFWDIVVIDGDHRADAVQRDATLAMQLLKPGGWLLFDDVRTQVPKKDEVEVGLRRFLDVWGGSLELAWSHRFCECYELRVDDYESSESDSRSYAQHEGYLEEPFNRGRAYRHYRSQLRKES